MLQGCSSGARSEPDPLRTATADLHPSLTRTHLSLWGLLYLNLNALGKPFSSAMPSAGRSGNPVGVSEKPRQGVSS